MSSSPSLDIPIRCARTRGRSTMVLLSTDTNWRSCGAAPHATPPSPWPQYVVLEQKRLVATKRSGRQGPAEQQHGQDEPQSKPRVANVQRTRTQSVEPLSQRFFENLHTGPRRLGKTPLERSHGSPPARPPESGWSSLASSPRVAPLSARSPRAGEIGAQPSDSRRASETPGGAPLVELAFRSPSSRRASHTPAAAGSHTPAAAGSSHPECSPRPSHAPPQLDHDAQPSEEEQPLNLLADVQWILFPRATDKPLESAPPPPPSAPCRLCVPPLPALPLQRTAAPLQASCCRRKRQVCRGTRSCC